MRVVRVLVAVSLLVVVGASTAGADIPDSDGNVYACYLFKAHSPLPKGNLRVIDNDKGGQCNHSKEGFVPLQPGTVVVSDREAKEAFRSVDGSTILALVAKLPISSWTYKSGSARHIGPVAQDFNKLFGTGPDDRHIDLINTSGVNLAATKALDGIVRTQQYEIYALGALLVALMIGFGLYVKRARSAG